MGVPRLAMRLGSWDSWTSRLLNIQALLVVAEEPRMESVALGLGTASRPGWGKGEL